MGPLPMPFDYPKPTLDRLLGLATQVVGAEQVSLELVDDDARGNGTGEFDAARSVPIEWAGRVRGSLTAEISGRLEKKDLDALAMLGRLTAAALEHAEMGSRLDPSMRVRVETMGSAMR